MTIGAVAVDRCLQLSDCDVLRISLRFQDRAATLEILHHSDELLHALLEAEVLWCTLISL